MMDESRGGFLGLGGLGSAGISSGGSGLSKLSPYLNVDPSYLQTETPEYILNQDQKRGRMEHSFTAIGTSVIVGSGIGGAYGLYDGVRQSALSGMSGKLRRTQILNHTLKSGARMSNALGSLAVIYSCFYSLVSQVHEEDDELKSCVSGAVTGALYKSTAGVKKTLAGGAIGLTIAAAWAFLLKRDERIANYV